MASSNGPVDVLVLSHRYEITSGGEKALMDLIEYLVSLNKRVHVVSGGNGSIEKYLSKWNIPYTIVHLPFWARGGEDPTPFTFDQPFNPTNDTTLKLTELIKQTKPKLCLTNTIVVPWLAYAAALTNTPHAWMIHELDTQGLNLRYAIDKDSILKTIDALSDKIFYNSHFTAAYYTPKFIFNKDAAVIYPSGNKVSEAVGNNPFSTTGLKLAFVGQIKEQKGQHDAVRAAAKLKQQGINFELLLIGSVAPDDEPFKNELLSIIKEYNLDKNVTFFGHSDAPTSLLKYADVALNCATNETFGRVTVESMLCGVPIIGAASAGTTEIITDGESGLLYEPGDAAELAEKIITLYKDADLRERIQRTAQKTALHMYSDEQRFKPFISYLEDGIKKTALNLTPLSAIVDDFQSTLQTSSRSTLVKRVVRKLKRIATRALNR